MSIKGSGSELYVGKKESNIITSFGNKNKIIYDELDIIEFSYAKMGESGYLEFINNNGKHTRFEFYKNVNDKIEMTIELIHNNNPNLNIVEHRNEDLKFYQRWWFAFISLFFCCFPLGLFLLWRNKKFTKVNRITMTIVASLFFFAGAYPILSGQVAASNDLNENSFSDYTEPEPQSTNVASTDNNSETSAESKNEETQDDEYFSVGDVYENDDIKIMFLGCGDYSTDNQFLQPDSGNKYVYAEFSIENISDSDQYVGYSDFSCYADNTEAKQALVTSEGAMTLVTSLSPGRNTKGKIFYEVPSNSEVIEIEYEDNILLQDKIYFKFE